MLISWTDSELKIISFSIFMYTVCTLYVIYVKTFKSQQYNCAGDNW